MSQKKKGGYHSVTLTSHSSDVLLEFVYCDLVPILLTHTIQIGQVVDVMSASYTLTKNVPHKLNW
jgi:hypothetical protein